MSTLVKKIIPRKIYNFLNKKWQPIQTLRTARKTYLYDCNNYIKHSNLLGNKSEANMISQIIREYHAIEKGLTMPKVRLGFGKDVLINLCNNCILYSIEYTKNEDQLIQAISVIKEYRKFHEQENFTLSSDIITAINNIENKNITTTYTPQKKEKKENYFKHINASFPEFAKSRSSIRNYSDNHIPISSINKALELSRTTPSACNRQCWRTYIFTNKKIINEILQTQGGNRGFGHLSDKLIVITAETGVFSGINERNQAYIDGGMYTMNLLYALHYNKIAACTLNCAHTIDKDISLRKTCRIKDSEVFIAIITCGIPPEEFQTTASKRYNLSKTNTII